VAVSAEVAVKAWANGRPDLIGQPPQNPGPLGGGAHLLQERSPAYGAYAVIARQGGPVGGLCAEPNVFDMAHIIADIRAGTIHASEAAAAAYATAVRGLAGCPEACGDTGVIVRCSDNVTGPVYLQQPPDSGEQWLFRVEADFLLQGPVDGSA
jgi:hypothetical protein